MRARGLLEDNENPDADSKVQEALTLISAARTAIVDGDYQYARKALSAAFSALNEAEKLHDDGGDDDSDDGSGKNDQESEGSDHGSDHEKEESDHDDNENSSNDDNSGTG
jgi:hypothetical protein